MHDPIRNLDKSRELRGTFATEFPSKLTWFDRWQWRWPLCTEAQSSWLGGSAKQSPEKKEYFERKIEILIFSNIIRLWYLAHAVVCEKGCKSMKGGKGDLKILYINVIYSEIWSIYTIIYDTWYKKICWPGLVWDGFLLQNPLERLEGEKVKVN